MRNLGIVVTDPNEYIRRHGSSLIRSQHLPDIAHKFSHREDIRLAADFQPPLGPIFEGDVHALKLVDLAQNGLLFNNSRAYPCNSNINHSSAFQQHLSHSFPASATLANAGSASPILLRSPPPPPQQQHQPQTMNLPSAVAAATSAAAAAVSSSAMGINATSMTIDEVYLTSDQHHSNTHESILTNTLLNNTLSS